ncbi:MAG: hypothetical protein ACYDD4_11875 [Acidimicrobiales bacterium]
MAEGADRKGIRSTGSETLHLVLDYAKQETLGPLKNLARFAAAGIAGSVLLGVGLSVLLLAGLRALQNETGSTFAGERSWMPYLAAAAAAVVIAGMAAWRITRGAATRRRGGERS